MSELRAQIRDQSGLTLIELLVCLVIIGVLAAIAIPAFLQVKAGGEDAVAKSMAHTAQLTAETLAVSDPSGYAAISKAALRRLEPTIATAASQGDAYLSAAKAIDGGYKLTVTAVDSRDSFTIERRADGSLVRECRIPTRTSPHGGCENVTARTGSW